jgi:hypothetical protein
LRHQFAHGALQITRGSYAIVARDDARDYPTDSTYYGGQSPAAQDAQSTGTDRGQRWTQEKGLRMRALAAAARERSDSKRDGSNTSGSDTIVGPR